jgi:hypothetical protein
MTFALELFLVDTTKFDPRAGEFRQQFTRGMAARTAARRSFSRFWRRRG